jgi:phosphoribosylglycinamide formyltransferase-1
MTTRPSRPLPIAVLISGGGTTLKNLIDRRHAGRLDVDFRLVISSTAEAKGLSFAVADGIETRVLTARSYPSAEAYGMAIFDACRGAGVEMVVMGGFLKYVPIPGDFENRVMNIHPALIPAFCGRGFYGARVHQAVLDYGAKVSGCTVHFADNQYDHGPIILQRTVPVLDDDTADSLAHRVFEEECEAYPQAVQWFAEGRIRVEGRLCKLVPPAA